MSRCYRQTFIHAEHLGGLPHKMLNNRFLLCQYYFETNSQETITVMLPCSRIMLLFAVYSNVVAQIVRLLSFPFKIEMIFERKIK
jgi:hypothetical protein